jgi:hypothetical protein
MICFLCDNDNFFFSSMVDKVVVREGGGMGVRGVH